MTTLWPAVIVAALGCYALKLAGVSLPESALNHPWVQRTAGLLPIAMLAALVVIDLFGTKGRYSADWQAFAGVAAGAVALRLGQGLVVVFLVAIALTALLRAVS
jgi:branched-subunit amino acid transport protein